MKQLTIIISIILGSGSIAFAQETEPAMTCQECHSDYIKHEYMHMPAEDDCETCHMANGNKHPRTGIVAFELADVMPSLCYLCHEEPTKSLLHAPYEMGECTMCHSPHGSNAPGMLLNSPQSAMCAECHDMSMTEKKNVHMPLEDGTCNMCHDPHQSDNPYLLATAKPQLCKDCHYESEVESEMEYQHMPFADDCINCHSSHSSDEQHLLTQSSPALCYECHGMEAELAEANSVHGAVNKGEACSSCHSPHASKEPALLLKTGKQLCMDCHNQEIENEERTVANIGQSLKEGNYIHGVIEMDGCIVCHSPHYSDKPKLLAGVYPQDEYAAATMENFDLCFLCHDYAMLEEETTDWATEFRDGERNMHQLHINGEKGRNCNLCHDIHGSPNEHLIANKVMFGNWEMPVEFRHSENGGSCRTGCHAELSYSRLVALPDSVMIQ